MSAPTPAERMAARAARAARRGVRVDKAHVIPAFVTPAPAAPVAHEPAHPALPRAHKDK